MKIEIYTTTTCGFCWQSKELVKRMNMEYIEHAITPETNEVLIKQLTERLGKQPTSVPQIFIDDVYLGGYHQLSEWAAARTA